VPDSLVAASIATETDLDLPQQLVDESVAIEDIAHQLVAHALLDRA
jgi:hypothetical protein